MACDPPPIQERTTDPSNNRFPSVWLRWFEDICDAVNSVLGFSNIVIVKSASDLAGTLDSTKTYIIDGDVDMGSQQITVPEGGLSIAGLNGARDTSILRSSENSYDMFISPSGSYSGNLVLEGCTLNVSGTSSNIFNLTNDENSGAIDITGVNFGYTPVDRLTSLGELTAYRQILFNGVGFLFCDDGLTLSGTWSGLSAVTSIAISFADGATLFKEGAGLTFSGSVRSDMNFISTGSTSVFMDFQESNILSDGGLDLSDVRTEADDIVPNLPSSNVKARVRNCRGLKNTYVGGEWTVSTSTATVISSANTLVKMAGTTTYSDLQWFSNTTDNAFVYDSGQTIEVEVKGSLSFSGSSNRVMGIQVRQWDDSASTYVDIGARFTATLNGGGAGNRAENVAFFAVITELEENDRIEVWIENQTDTSNITCVTGGIVDIAERSS